MAVLRKIRIGTDITLGITVMASGHAVDWDAQDIKRVFAFSDIQGQPVAEMSYEQRGSTLRCIFHAEDQNYVGTYRVIIEFNDGSAFSSTLDMPAFELVRTSEEADINTGEVVLDIDGAMRFYSLAEVISKLEGLHTEVKASAAAAREASDNANDAAALANSNASKAEASNKIINDNERKRIAQETARESAEAERQRAEIERQKGDESIAEKEAIRERNEEVRESNEATRESNELERRNAESARDRAESKRASEETTRISNETSRQDAENKRMSAETSRKEAESARVKAEAERVSEFGRLKTESETATKNAQDAADIAAVNILALDIAVDSGIVTVTTGGDSSAFSSGGVDSSTGDIALTFNYD